MQKDIITINLLIMAIKRLPEDSPQVKPGVWYKTQKQHWLGWLKEYNTTGAYGRKNLDRDAKFAYNHVVCPDLLLYLIRAIPLNLETVAEAEEAGKKGKSLMEKAGAIRKVVPWEMIDHALWGENKRG